MHDFCSLLSLCRGGRRGRSGGIGQLGRMSSVHHAIRIVQCLRVLQLHQIVLLSGLVQRQLRQGVIDGEPLALTADAARVLPLVQLLGHIHNKDLGAMHMVVVLEVNSHIICNTLNILVSATQNQPQKLLGNDLDRQLRQPLQGPRARL